MKVAFWNVNTGKGSVADRKTTLTNWCGEMNLDLLILEEVSSKFSDDDMEQITGLTKVAHVGTLDVRGRGTTKQIWALKRAGMPFEGRALRLPNLRSIRMGIKVSYSNQFAIWGLHANSSYRGGRNTVNESEAYLLKYQKIVIGGDFNCPNAYAENKSVGMDITKSWQNNDLKFSQWKKEYGTRMTYPDPDFHLATKDCGLLTVIPTKNKVIDYVMYGSSRTVLPARSCLSETRWVQILKQFDHSPVVYNIT
ncbi:endonuclease/exonuclease/phosphatase family protein [Paenibacillus gansuensis]|uniref:Endonuclease/exonuclease/phosphatase family protein n=1 Tax=Paenibacillus gansuensis TaxID=306542 RepID=A0ABW5P8X0_9BACL